MNDIKSRAQGIQPSIESRDLNDFVKETGNVYETLNVISIRARQLNKDLKYELKNKLEEFAVQVDTIEEIQENREQVEISKFYERLPNPVLIAMDDYFTNKIGYKYRGADVEEEGVDEDNL